MAKIVQTTRNGDTVTTHTEDSEEIRKAEESTFDDSSNISSTHVTGL
jgi:hypothetical protein